MLISLTVVIISFDTYQNTRVYPKIYTIFTCYYASIRLEKKLSYYIEKSGEKVMAQKLITLRTIFQQLHPRAEDKRTGFRICWPELEPASIITSLVSSGK